MMYGETFYQNEVIQNLNTVGIGNKEDIQEHKLKYWFHREKHTHTKKNNMYYSRPVLSFSYFQTVYNLQYIITFQLCLPM